MTTEQTSKEALSKSLIANYKSELASALQMENEGITFVSPAVAGPELANGRVAVPISEFILMWAKGLVALESGEDPEKYNY